MVEHSPKILTSKEKAIITSVPSQQGSLYQGEAQTMDMTKLVNLTGPVRLKHTSKTLIHCFGSRRFHGSGADSITYLYCVSTHADLKSYSCI